MATKYIESGSDATQSLAFWSGTSLAAGTVATDSTQFQDGKRSIKCVVTSATGRAQLQQTAILADAGRRISCWMQFPTVAPSVDTGIISADTTGHVAVVIAAGLTTTGKLAIAGGGVTEQIGTTTLSANTWYRITFSYKITSSTNWTAKVFLNGNLEVTATNTDGTLSNVNTADMSMGLFGAPFTGGASIQTVFVDSVYVDDGTGVDDPGNIHVTAKRPFANGTTNAGTGSGAGSSYGSGNAVYVNEQPLTAGANHSVAIVGAGSALTEEYNLEGASVGDVDISSATLVDYMAWVFVKTGIAETGKIINNNVQTNISITTADKFFSNIAGSATYPTGTGTDIGVVTSTTVTTVTLEECGTVFAYIPRSIATNTSNFFFFFN